MSAPRALRRLDAFQQRHAVLGFPVAVLKKFSDDQAGGLAALIAFYGFLSVFPLLLVLVTVLGMLLSDNPRLQQQVLDSALTEFPVIGPQLSGNVHALGRSGFGLAVGLAGTLLGARGVASAIQNAMNRVWEVPRHERPGFPFSWLRNLGVIGLIGVGVLTTTGLSGIATWGADIAGIWSRIAVLAVSLVINVLLFWAGLRLATAPEVSFRDLRLGAVLAAIVWQVLQAVGGYVVAHDLRHASSVYGTFGLVLGLIAWLYLQARLTLYAVEADVVRRRGMWPRSLFPPPLTRVDREAYDAYAKAEQRLPETRIEMHVQDGAGSSAGDDDASAAHTEEA
ncbi:YihY/virulence factor BrkB family protein [Actinospica durhamensis]|uniref:YihY/virulence factor BrkB family protein n=1 Tax=Actinospica durhamensis TaxID=1508375 RepID=A0A941IVT9_9ACTN|nr:YihY/virulence factor BrkB family protein [Actinospica durhamensis]MBR7837746.1 YihY/virulence factor BrkB family protein [Actinospica durhamensis]